MRHDDRTRAGEHRAIATECDRRGFPAFAQWHREMAEWLDPPVREPQRTARRTGPMEES